MSIKKIIIGLTLPLLLASGCGPVDTVLYVIPAAVSVAEVVVSEVGKGISQRKERKKRKELFNDQVADNKREAKVENNARAFGQAPSAGLQTVSQQNLAGPGAETTYKNNAPAVIGTQNVTYKQSGNTAYGSDGTSSQTKEVNRRHLDLTGPGMGSKNVTYQTFGNTTFGSDGTSSQTFGNTTFGSDGTSSQTFGNTTFGSDGTSSQTFGNTTFGSDGTVCQTFGNTTFCN